MKISKILTLFLGVGLFFTTIASSEITIPGCEIIQEVWINKKFIKNDLTQADFMVSAVASSVAANMISTDNSLAKVTFGAAFSLLASAHAVSYYHNTGSTKLGSYFGTLGVTADSATINKVVALLIYFFGQNSMQIVDCVWNSKSYIKEILNFLSKSRDGKEMIAIALRNLAPLALLTENGSNGYKILQNHLKPTLDV